MKPVKPKKTITAQPLATLSDGRYHFESELAARRLMAELDEAGIVYVYFHESMSSHWITLK